MIPVGPLIAIAIYAYRRRNNRNTPKAAPRSSSGEVLRQLAIVLLWIAAVPVSVGGAVTLLNALEVPRAWGALVMVWSPIGSWLALSFAPAWASWRIARPLGQAWLARALFWWSPMARRFDRRGYARLVAASLGRPMPREGKEPDAPNAWTTCATALQAERLSDAAHADRLVAALAALPAGARFPRAARVIGIEALCWAAAERGDWDAVGKRAELGRGRGVRLLRLLAATRTAGGVTPLRLWTSWLLAPSRRRSLPLVSAALRSERPRVTGPSLLRHPIARRDGPWGLHLALLAERARGRAIPAPEVGRLVREWETKLGALDEARLRARGLELGARDAAAAAQSIRRSVLQQLEALAGAGPLPGLQGNAIAAELQRRSRDRLFDALQPFLERFRGELQLGTPLEEWERWLGFREAVDAIGDALGHEGLRTAWHAGVRTAAWNWPCKVLNAHDRRGAWASIVMFSWIAALAEKMGDDEAASVNRKNVEVARAAAAAV